MDDSTEQKAEAKIDWGEPPPIGRSWLEVTAEKRMAVEHIDLNEHPKMKKALEVSIENLNRIRAQVGVPPLEISTSQMRFVESKNWQDAREGLEGSDQFGFYDSQNNVVFVRTDEEHLKSETGEAEGLYHMVHEIGHLATPTVYLYSFHLSEGIADYLARKMLDDNTLRELFGDKVDDSHRRIIKGIDDKRPIIDDQEVRPAELIYSKEGGGALVFTMLAQQRMVRRIGEKLGADRFNEFLKTVFSGDTNSVKKFISDSLGDQMYDALNDTEGTKPMTEIRELLS